ncbi:MAG: nucleotide exchange factor GrpE [candidate division Zixibacteria bacterium]|nr:nucleotide exchange factor GrpE [candidate division Zixibacteria bacterium]
MSKKKEIEIEVKSSEEKSEREAELETSSGEAGGDKTPAISPEEGENGRPSQQPEEVGKSEEGLSEEEKLQEKVAQLEDRLLRTAAEFDNYKKRVARQYDDMVRSSNQRILGQMLEIVDNFERALEHGNDDNSLEGFRKGAELILGQMMDLLAKYDVRPIETIGKPFDPNLHEALTQVDSDEYEEGIVVLEMTRGYMLGNKVLRHSKVGVSRGRLSEDDASQE